MEIGRDRLIDTWYTQSPDTTITSGPYDTYTEAEAKLQPGEIVVNIEAV